MRGLKLGIVGALALASGCDDTPKRKEGATLACEAYVKDGLKAPSTYSRVSASSNIESKELGSVSIEYDAENSYGVPLRGRQSCAFKLDEEGKWPEPWAANFAAEGSVLEKHTRSINSPGNPDSDLKATGSSGYDCCLATEEE
jgi:hypothetical protein